MFKNKYLINNLHLLKNVKIYLIVSIIFLIAKLLILLVVLKKSNFQTHDSTGYLTLSRDIFNYYIERPNMAWELSLTRTPGYPLFLSFLHSSTTAVIIAQIILHLFISLISVVLITKLLKEYSTSIGILIFISSQIESSLFVYTYRILSEILFAFLITLFIYLMSLKHDRIKSKVLDSIILVVLVSIFMVRPVAIAFFLIFILMSLASEYKRLYLKLFLFSVLFIGCYSFYNFSTTGVFTYSTIQNHNLLYWEGAGAKAITKSVDLRSIQQIERQRKIIAIGDGPSLKVENKYNGDRGLELILDNKISFLMMHGIGAGRILFGPNKYEVVQIFGDSGRINLQTSKKHLLIYTSFLVTIVISLLGLFGSVKFFNKNATLKLASLTLLSLLIISGGPQAYGRFRAPVSPILVFFAVLVSFDIYRYFKRRYSKNNISS